MTKNTKTESSPGEGESRGQHRKQGAAARIKAAGKSLVWVTLNEADKSKIRVAAALQGMPMSQFLIKHGLMAAEKLLKKLPK